MKKILLSSLILVGFMSVSMAQETGDLRLGAGLIYGTEIEEAGININAEYLFTEKISVAPSYSIFFTPDPVSYNVLNIDGRYYFLSGSAQVYGLLGFANATSKVEFLGAKIKASDSGLNIGGGAVFPLSDTFGINAQLKYSTPGNGQLVFQGGLVYTIKTK
ncbi:MAG: hypothetical protein R2804_00575 [Cyclobacteriaceae bacterium]